MSATIKCDGCGKEAPMVIGYQGWAKPGGWLQRQDADGIQDACSRECIDIIAKKSGKTSVVLPF
jgi:ADP-ribose pyrophosphatase YjhB (NUDIX family)